MADKVNRSEQSVEELSADLAILDAEMAAVREQKEANIAALRVLQRRRDEITEPLERKVAAARTNPVTEIGL